MVPMLLPPYSFIYFCSAKFVWLPQLICHCHCGHWLQAPLKTPSVPTKHFDVPRERDLTFFRAVCKHLPKICIEIGLCVIFHRNCHWSLLCCLLLLINLDPVSVLLKKKQKTHPSELRVSSLSPTLRFMDLPIKHKVAHETKLNK